MGLLSLGYCESWGPGAESTTAEDV